MNHATFPFNLPLMDKISMNENQRTSFHFYRHKILLVIRRGRLIKVHPIFPSKKPSDQAIFKHHRAGKKILDKENSNRLILLARQKRNGRRELLLWDPGMAQRQPFSRVASSRASHIPVQVVGSVYRNELSWCGTTSPPIPGCCE